MDSPSALEDIRPLLLQWLMEWKNAASKTGSKMEFVYRNALKSLRAHDQPVKTASECRKIKYFGEKLCQRVSDTLSDHYKKLGITLETEEESRPSSSQVASQSSPKKSQAAKTSRPKSSRSYIPQPRSGAFAILVTLLKAEEVDVSSLTKAQILTDAQQYCDESMSKPKSGSHFTAFSSMKTLVKKNLVSEERHRCSVYALTEDGRELAKKLLAYLEKVGQVTKSCESEGGTQAIISSQSSAGEFKFNPGEFEIILLVDTREQTSGVDQNLKKTALMSSLLQKGVATEMRALPVGDFAWIAKEKSVPYRELIMDYVVERKRVDDLVGSIVDGRFQEQKHRLKSCGIRNPTYLVESLTRGDYSVPYRNLLQAVNNSQIIDGFNVKYMRDYSETIMYLVSMTRSLSRKFRGVTLNPCCKSDLSSKPFNFLMSYSEYESGSKKTTNFTASEMLLKQLLQISGMSVLKAKSVTDIFPTIQHLIEGYENCENEKEKIKLTSTLKSGAAERSLGPVLAKKLMIVYSK